MSRTTIEHDMEEAISDRNRRLLIDHLTLRQTAPTSFVRSLFRVHTDEQIVEEVVAVHHIEEGGIVNRARLFAELGILRETFPDW